MARGNTVLGHSRNCVLFIFLYLNVFMYVCIYAAMLGLGSGVQALSLWPVTASLAGGRAGRSRPPRALCRRGGVLLLAGPGFSSRRLVELQSAGSRAQ